jgi:hypothetical protein
LRQALLLPVAACLLACSFGESSNDTYSGYFIYGYEVQALAPDGVKERWWIEGGPFPCLETEPTSEYRSGGPIAYVTVRGKLERGGKYEYDGYAQTIYVTDVLSCRRIRKDERVPIEF